MRPAGSNPPSVISSRFLIFLVVLFVVCVLIPPLLNHGPSFAKQKIEQRRLISERVQAAGGWSAVRRDCESLVVNITNSSQNNFYWQPPWTNAHVIDYSNSVPIRSFFTNIDYGLLPPAVAKLQPHEVGFDWAANSATIVKIRLFGLHRTGSWDIPYYGLWVVCNSTNQDFTPKIIPPFYKGINKVADFIFEVYQ